MRVPVGCRNVMKLGAFLLASVCAWYLGCLFAYIIPEDAVTVTFNNIQNVAEKPRIPVPPPKRQKCDHWSPCPPQSYAYRLRSGGGKEKMAKICFEDELLIGEQKKNVGRGINIAIVDYGSGKIVAAKYFDMWEGAYSAPMTDFIRKTPPKSLLLMVTHDDGSNRLQTDAKKAIAELGSKEIWNIRFRSSWAFIAAKGFNLPNDIEKEKINHSDMRKNRYSGWPAEIQIEGCIPQNLTK